MGIISTPQQHSLEIDFKKRAAGPAGDSLIDDEKEKFSAA